MMQEDLVWGRTLQISHYSLISQNTFLWDSINKAQASLLPEDAANIPWNHWTICSPPYLDHKKDSRTFSNLLNWALLWSQQSHIAMMENLCQTGYRDATIGVSSSVLLQELFMNNEVTELDTKIGFYEAKLIWLHGLWHFEFMFYF